MAVALVQLCVDDRLNHELLRIQVKQKLASLYLEADRVFFINSPGGNFSDSFRDTARFMKQSSQQIVLAAVLHHDDCLADQAGLRVELSDTQATIHEFLAGQQSHCVIASGQIHTHNNHIIWLEERHTTAS